jgi:hypothetical protein
MQLADRQIVLRRSNRGDWAGHKARKGKDVHTKFWQETMKEREYLAGGRILDLKEIEIALDKDKV